eukprot:7241692-Pyramimonas_sp.AAC.1
MTSHPDDDLSDAAPPEDDKVIHDSLQLWIRTPDRSDSEVWSPYVQAASREAVRDRNAPGDL